LEGVKAALKSGADVNTKDDYGSTGLMWAMINNHNSVVALLLSTPNINVNQKDNQGWSALHFAAQWKNNETLKLLLNVPSIDVNIVAKNGYSAVHEAVYRHNIEGLKLLLSHPSLTALTLNQKDNGTTHGYNGYTPVMLAVRWNRLEHLEVLVADPRVDLDITDKEEKSLEVGFWRYPKTRKVLAEAKQRREEKRRLNRLIRKQQRQVSNAPPSPSCSASAWRSWGRSSGRSWWRTGRSTLNKMNKMKMFSEHLRPPVHLSAKKLNVQFYKSIHHRTTLQCYIYEENNTFFPRKMELINPSVYSATFDLA